MKQSTAKPVLYFDGVCNLCNRFVQWIIKHDRRNVFMFASLQSEAGEHVTDELTRLHGKAPDSLVLAWKGRYYIKSDAALQVGKIIGGFWKIVLLGFILPRAFRDKIYDWVARNRYKWLGKRDSCMIPSPELKDRFL